MDMPPMGDEMAQAPNNMPPMDEPQGGDDMPPMDEPQGGDDMNGGNSDTQEIDDIFNQMSIEDKNAVIKYAKSMLDNGDDENEMQDQGENMGMPMESRRYLSKRVNEICNGVFDKRVNKKEREEKTLIGNRDNPTFKRRNPFVLNR